MPWCRGGKGRPTPPERAGPLAPTFSGHPAGPSATRQGPGGWRVESKAKAVLSGSTATVVACQGVYPRDSDHGDKGRKPASARLLANHCGGARRLHHGQRLPSQVLLRAQLDVACRGFPVCHRRHAQGLDGHRLRVQQLSSWGWPAARSLCLGAADSEWRVPLSTASEPHSTCRGNPSHGEERRSPFPHPSGCQGGHPWPARSSVT